MIGVDEYLRQPGLRRALAGARARVERLGRAGGTVALDALTEQEASALSGLLGGLRRRERPHPGRPFRASVGDLDRALRASRFEISLVAALERLGGPLDLAPGLRERERAAAERMWETALAHPLCLRDARVREWVERLRARGSLPRSNGPALLAQALELGQLLPGDRAMERTRLAAAELGGDPHALDDARPLSRLVLGQLAARADRPRPETAVARRELWRRFGVLADSASADVLAVGLRPLSGGPLSEALRLLHGWHFRLTIGQLSRERLAFPAGLDVFLCENVTVLTAAEARHGDRCAPLVCLEGWPSSAGWALLEALTASDARLHYHGDFDWDGVRIAALVLERFAARPWRFEASDYRSAIARHGDRTRPLPAREIGSGAQEGLVTAMREAGRELHEEAVLDDLLGDLATGF